MNYLLWIVGACTVLGLVRAFLSRGSLLPENTIPITKQRREMFLEQERRS